MIDTAGAMSMNGKVQLSKEVLLYSGTTGTAIMQTPCISSIHYCLAVKRLRLVLSQILA